jgi:hypothetical protein
MPESSANCLSQATTYRLVDSFGCMREESPCLAGVCLKEAKMAMLGVWLRRASRVAAVAVADAPVKVADGFSVPFDRLLENVAEAVEIIR